MKTPSEKTTKEKILFIGCLPSSNDLPAQFPENGGRAPAMLKWYTKHADLSPSEALVLRDIVAELNFNDFYSDWRTINQGALADGINMERTTVNLAVQSLKERGVFETLKLPNNTMKFRLTRKITDGYLAYVKESCPHKFPSGNDTPERHPCLNIQQALVGISDKPLLDNPTTSYLSIPPLNHPNSKTPISPFGETIAGDSPQTPRGIADKYYLGEGIKLGCLVIEIGRYSKDKRPEKIALIKLIQEAVKPPKDVYDYFRCKVTNNQKIGMDFDAITDDIATFLAEREQINGMET